MKGHKEPVPEHAPDKGKGRGSSVGTPHGVHDVVEGVMVEQQGVLLHEEKERGKGPLEVEGVTKGGEVGEEGVCEWLGREGLVGSEGLEGPPCLISVAAYEGLVEGALQGGKLLRGEARWDLLGGF